MGSINRRIVVQVGLGLNGKPFLKNTSSKKGWGMAQIV
jgi:hypothetical protein